MNVICKIYMSSAVIKYRLQDLSAVYLQLIYSNVLFSLMRKMWQLLLFKIGCAFFLYTLFTTLSSTVQLCFISILFVLILRVSLSTVGPVSHHNPSLMCIEVFKIHKIS